MQTPSIPHGSWSEVWLYALISVVSLIAGLIPGWWNRKKPAIERSEIGESNARAQKTLADAIVAMSARALEAQTEIEAQRARHVKETGFLQKQIEHRQEQEEDARTRAHNAFDEINRCVRVIKQYELMMSDKIEFNPFIVKTYKEIMGEDESA